MSKEKRLAFRIKLEIDDQINDVIKTNDEIKDRSDFGNKAVTYYVQYLKNRLVYDNQFILCDKGPHIVKMPLKSTEGLICDVHLIDSDLKFFDAVDILNFMLAHMERAKK